MRVGTLARGETSHKVASSKIDRGQLPPLGHFPPGEKLPYWGSCRDGRIVSIGGGGEFCLSGFVGTVTRLYPTSICGVEAYFKKKIGNRFIIDV